MLLFVAKRKQNIKKQKKSDKIKTLKIASPQLDLFGNNTQNDPPITTTTKKNYLYSNQLIEYFVFRLSNNKN